MPATTVAGERCRERPRARAGTAAGSDAVFFDLPDGATLAVQPVEAEAAQRTVGLLVDDVEAAVGELRAAGIETDDVVQAVPYRYAHFGAPDGALYELVQRR